MHMAAIVFVMRQIYAVNVSAKTDKQHLDDDNSSFNVQVAK